MRKCRICKKVHPEELRDAQRAHADLFQALGDRHDEVKKARARKEELWNRWHGF